MLRFHLHLFQSNTQHYKQRTVQEASLQSIQSLRKYRQDTNTAIGSYIMLSQIDTLLSLSAKELEHKGGHKQVHDVCIVHTVVGKKAHLEMK